MATGVIGKSLKGHPKVYLSADGGVQWHEVSVCNASSRRIMAGGIDSFLF